METKYYNASGGTYTNEDYSFWENPPGSGVWYRGDKLKNIVRVNTPTWAQSSGFPIMPIAGAAAGYFLGGKSILWAVAGFAAGTLLGGD